MAAPIPDAPLPPPAEAPHGPPGGGLARRFAAFAIDAAILVGFANALLAVVDAWLLGPWIATFGHRNHLVGLAIVMAYFAWFDARPGGGATPGKRMLRLVVEGPDGPIGPLRAAWRLLVCLAPFSIDLAFSLAFKREGVDGPSMPMTGALFAGWVLMGGAILAALYLPLADRRTRRTLQDRLSGTRVLRADLPAPAPAKSWRGHTVVVGLILLTLSLGAFGVFARLPWDAPAHPRPTYSHARDAAFEAAWRNRPEIRHASTWFEGIIAPDGGPDASVEAIVIRASTHGPATAPERLALGLVADARRAGLLNHAADTEVVLTFRHSIGLAWREWRWAETRQTAAWR